MKRKALWLVAMICGGGVSTDVIAADPMSDAAAKVAWQTFMARQVVCGESLLTAIDVQPPTGPMAPLGAATTGHTIYIETRQVMPKLVGKRDGSNEVDRLNGLNWVGRFDFVAGALREVSIGKNGTASHWSQWTSSIPLGSVTVRLQSGTWQAEYAMPVQVTTLNRAGFRKPDCTEVSR
jgi:hypothetical protein